MNFLFATFQLSQNLLSVGVQYVLKISSDRVWRPVPATVINPGRGGSW